MFIVLIFLLSGCAATNVKDGSDVDDINEGKDATVSEVPFSKRVYYLQHKLISKWLFETDGAFFFDMKNGNASQLFQAASEIVSPEYADELYITPIEGREAVSIRFSEPEAYANCYYSIITKDGDEFSYYTYEKAMSFGSEPVVGVVGGWDSKGDHSNYGPRSYRSEEDFIKDVLQSD
ncbi:hypothetical protein SAMN02745866_01227 [Alteromonadaceae bacterium Bs31]|nr:hypothetical protein SAMN02745866_01227 [Alteromonadaceae bacterium Bs31]